MVSGRVWGGREGGCRLGMGGGRELTLSYYYGLIFYFQKKPGCMIMNNLFFNCLMFLVWTPLKTTARLAAN